MFFLARAEDASSVYLSIIQRPYRQKEEEKSDEGIERFVKLLSCIWMSTEDTYKVFVQFSERSKQGRRLSRTFDLDKCRRPSKEPPLNIHPYDIK